MKTIETAIADGWGWAVSAPVALLDINSFGNVIICDSTGRYYRIIPEDLECRFLTEDDKELQRIRESEAFKTDWAMQPLFLNCEAELGPLADGQCYHLVTPSVLGGAYSVENVRKISITDWLGGAGSLARQIQGLSNGTKVVIKPQ
jgi:hypothetical protein